MALVLLMGGILIALQHPKMQTWLTGKLTTYLQEETGFPIHIRSANITWFDALRLHDLEVLDQQDSLMITVQEVYVDFTITDLIRKDRPALDKVALRNPDVRLYKNTPDSSLNIDQFIKKLRDVFTVKQEGPKVYTPFFIEEVSIIDGKFTYHDPHKDSLEEIFDYNHFQLTNLQAGISSFRVNADTLDMLVHALSAQALNYPFTIDSLSTNYRYTETGMDFAQLYLKAGSSILRDSLSFRYSNPASLGYFVDSVRIGAHLKTSQINTQQLAVFAPIFKDFSDLYFLSGEFDGTVSNFRARKLDASFGSGTRIQGSLQMDGLPDFQETFINADFKRSRIKPTDILPYIDARAYESLQRMGTIDFSSSFIGFPNDFVAQGRFLTRLGIIDTDLNLKLSEQPQNSSYSGSLALDNFDLGKLLENSLLGKIGLTSEISGKGLTLASAQLEVSAEAAFLGLKDYQYQNIIAKGKLARQFFSGELKIDDPNLRFEGDASFDFRNNNNLIKINAQLDTANLYALNLSQKPLSLHSQINADLQGITLDSLQGTAYLGNIEVIYDGRSLAFDTLALHSSHSGKERQLSLKTDQFDLHAEGNFTFQQVARDINRLVKEYSLNFRNQLQEISSYYAEKPNIEQQDYERYTIDFSLQLAEPDPVVKLWLPDLHLSDNLSLEGSFTGGYTSILSAYTKADTIQYGPNFFYGVEVDVNTSKIADSTDVLAMAFVQSQAQEMEGIAATERLVFEGIWLQDHIDLRGEIHQQEKNNFLDLAADIYFLEDTTLFQFAPSTLRVLDNNWRFSDNNQLFITKNDLQFKDFKLFHQNQVFLVEGTLSSDSSKVLNVRMDSVMLTNLNPISPYELDGILEGELAIRQNQKAAIFSGEIDLTDFLVDGFPVGNVHTQLNWLPDTERVYVDLFTELQGNTVLTVKGTYAPFEEENQLGLDAIFNKTQLNLLEPVLDAYFSDISGWVSGQAVITGTPKAPIIRGGGSVNEATIKINYTGTNYRFDGNFVLLENEIGFRNLELRDTEGHPAYLNGGLFHDSFRDFVIDLQVELQETKVLNTTYEENSLYYGVAYATGSLEILGPVNNLLFNAEARTAKGTKIYIPINEDNSLSSKEYIHFVSRRDSSQLDMGAVLGKKLNVSGIKLNFDLDVTTDAYVEVIFDLRSGDIIRGRGQGKLEMDIDTRGEFTMFGTYEITEGAYNFTLFNVITKEFIIDPGSTIRWAGDPYGGQLDIDAEYIQYASLAPLLSSATNDPSASRAYPIILNMDLTGDLLSPDISFDINFEEYPQTYYNELQRFKQSLQIDEQLLNRQVFNLIVLRQFIPNEEYNPVGVGSLGSRTAISSISELLSNQFSMLASQIDDNLEIDLDVSSTISEEAINTFQLRLSYTFLNGRLRVTRDGSLSTQSTTSNNANLVGNWTVEYLLTPDGQYRIKMYSRNNQSQISADFKPETQQGFSFAQSKSFDNLKELFERNRRTKPLTPKPVEPDNDIGDLLREEEN